MAKATLPPKAILVWLPGALHKELLEAVASSGGSMVAFVRAAIQYALRTPDDARWRELPLKGGPGQDISQQLTWILARSPSPSDWLGSGGELDKRVAREIRRVLKGNVLAQRRVTAWLQAKGYEEQALTEGVSRQAIQDRKSTRLNSSH